MEVSQGNIYYSVQISWKKIHIHPCLIGFYLSSVGRSISIFLSVYLCHSAFDRNKWNLWKSETKDNPVSNSNLVCSSPRKKHHWDIMLVSLFCLLAPYFSLFILTNSTSPWNSSQGKRERVSGKSLGNVTWVRKKGQAFLRCARTLPTKTEGEEARATEDSFVLSSSQEAAVVWKRCAQQAPLTSRSFLNYSCTQQKRPEAGRAAPRLSCNIAEATFGGLADGA